MGGGGIIPFVVKVGNSMTILINDPATDKKSLNAVLKHVFDKHYTSPPPLLAARICSRMESFLLRRIVLLQSHNVANTTPDAYQK